MACPFYCFKDNDYHCNLCGRDVNSDLYSYKCKDWNYDTCPIYNENEAVGTCYYDSKIKKVVYKYEDKTTWNNSNEEKETVKQNPQSSISASRPLSSSSDDNDGCLGRVVFGAAAAIPIIAIVGGIVIWLFQAAIPIICVFVVVLLITFLIAVKQSKKLTDEERIQLDIDEAEQYNKAYGEGSADVEDVEQEPIEADAGDYIYITSDNDVQTVSNEIFQEELNSASNEVSISPQVDAPISPADEIMKYKQLLDCGALTQEEFNSKKKQLLGI